MLLNFLLILAAIIILLSIFIIILKNKIDSLESYIKNLFNIRTNIIPSLFEVSRSSLIRHEEIFREIIKLRKISFSERSLGRSLSEMIGTEQLIHNELNFIFKVCNRHKKLLINGKFIYLRDLVISSSSNIGDYLKLYKNIVKKYNLLIRIKNYSIIGLLIPIETKEEF
ncbi:hypothetical protein CSB07_00230 [Candidatus Gracilibacteria bacterium]|nr:MAG: hypothetical protein CSB07_00230 [Candidatus Gracilibacteria bacterium]PIE85651.1 MAG: hypothetical protein CSA08_00940 [Candidatus Gracilibacteria bacterium]